MKISSQILLSFAVVSFAAINAGQATASRTMQPKKMTPVAAVETTSNEVSSMPTNSLTPVTKEAYDAHNKNVNGQRATVDNHTRMVEEKRKERDEALVQLNSKASSMKASQSDHAHVEKLNNECERLHKELVQHVRRLEDLMSSYGSAN